MLDDVEFAGEQIPGEAREGGGENDRVLQAAGVYRGRELPPAVTPLASALSPRLRGAKGNGDSNMPRVRLPVMVQDPLICELKGMEFLENVFIDGEEFFLDGPVSERVAVLDFDEASGQLRTGVPYAPPAEGRKVGEYKIVNRADLRSRDLQAASVFGTVLKTMAMFESNDALGRRLTWAFEAPQLLVVPRAGDMPNAYYERESHSLQFFSFAGRRGTIFSCMSRDIVAHETAHAIIDGIVPDLYHASSPQALAFHESLADLTALLSAFYSDELSARVLEQTNGSIDKPSAFSMVAEEFGRGRDPRGDQPLRSLINDRTFDPDETEPHDLSEVLSGALYAVMVQVYAEWRKRFKPQPALAVAREQFKRMLLRALDYLPPGEISFADYGRAILASDEAAHPADPALRDVLADEFVKRKIVRSRRELRVKTNFGVPAVEKVDLETLRDSDWAAYEFANRNREFLGIPKGIHFRVLERRDVSRRYMHRGGQENVRECIFRVSWDHKEKSGLGSIYPSERQITVGTTLAIDWKTRRVRVQLHSDFAKHQRGRAAFVKQLADEGRLRFGDEADGVRDRAVASFVRAERMNGLMRVRGTARSLHIGTRQP